MIAKQKVQRWYVNDALEKTEVTIEDEVFTISKMPVFDGMSVLNRTTSLFSPLGGVLGDGEHLDFSAISKIDDQRITEHIKTLCEFCQKDGKQVVFDADMKNYKMPYILAWEFVKWNFKDFLTSNPRLQKVAEKAMGVDLEKMKKM